MTSVDNGMQRKGPKNGAPNRGEGGGGSWAITLKIVLKINNNNNFMCYICFSNDLKLD